MRTLKPSRTTEALSMDAADPSARSGSETSACMSAPGYRLAVTSTWQLDEMLTVTVAAWLPALANGFIPCHCPGTNPAQALLHARIINIHCSASMFIGFVGPNPPPGLNPPGKLPLSSLI